MDTEPDGEGDMEWCIESCLFSGPPITYLFSILIIEAREAEEAEESFEEEPFLLGALISFGKAAEIGGKK